MSRRSRPQILIVDDDLDDALTLAGEIEEDALGHAVRPGEVTEDRLRNADLVLVDYELVRWDERDALQTIGLKPRNGLALASVLRAHIDALHEDYARGVALYSGQVEKIAPRLPPEVRRHVLARLHNLEWVFEKGQTDAPSGILSLVQALRQLPAPWPEDASAARHELQFLLGLSSENAFFEQAWQDVEDCHPPIHELSEATHTLAILRWLAQRILPYPTFLLDKYHVAARLGMGARTFKEICENESELTAALDTTRYNGALKALVGNRWWRAGIEGLIIGWTDGSFDRSKLHAAIQDRAKVEYSAGAGDQIVALGESLAPLGVSAADESIRIRPDDWPPFADDAWATISDCRADPRLAALVVPEDRHLLSE